MDESAIIERCQRGEMQHFGLLYDAYIGKIYRFVYYKTMHRESAEDLTSQTFFKALEAMPSFDLRKGSFSSWLYRIARNNVIDFYRTNRNIDDIDSVYGLSATTDTAADLDVAQLLAEVRTYLESLKPEQREIVMLRLWDQLSYREISEITGKSIGNCKMTFSRTLARLRAVLPITSLILLLLIINR